MKTIWFITQEAFKNINKIQIINSRYSQLIILKEEKKEMWNVFLKTLNILRHVNIKNPTLSQADILLDQSPHSN